MVLRRASLRYTNDSQFYMFNYLESSSIITTSHASTVVVFVVWVFCVSEKEERKTTMDSRIKDWFDAVSSGNIAQIQRLITDEMPVDIISEVKSNMFFSW